MKMRKRSSVEVPAPIKELISALLAAADTNDDAFTAALQGFAAWEFGKGDLNHWVDLMNRFDDVLERTAAALDPDGADAVTAPQPSPQLAALTVQVLRVTRVLLENCNNKHLYASVNTLEALLSAADTAVVGEALVALAAFVRRGGAVHTPRSMRWQGHASLNARLFALAQGPGAREERRGLVACVSADGAEQLDRACTGELHFEFYLQSAPAAAATEQATEPPAASAFAEPGKLQVIHLTSLQTRPETDHVLCASLVAQHKVPKDLRFNLLTRVRAARAFGTLDGRRQITALRLLALTVLLQSNPDPDDMFAFFANEPDFVSELVALMYTQMSAAVPETVQVLAVRLLAVLAMDRARQSGVLQAISAGSNRGMLAALMQSAIGSLAPPAAASPADTQSAPVTSTSISASASASTSTSARMCSYAFVEALVSLVAALVSTAAGWDSLAEVGLVPLLLPLLRDTAREHVPLVTSAVRVLEVMMDLSTSAARAGDSDNVVALLCDLGGLADIENRLLHEVELVWVLPCAVEDKDKDATPMETTSAASTTAAKGKATATTTAAGTSVLAQAPAKEKVGVPYAQRLLIKALLRAVALAQSSPGSGVRATGLETGVLASSLKSIFLRAAHFGGGVFSLAASVMRLVIHHDPRCFPQLEAAGLPEAFLQAVRNGVLASADAVCCVPNTLTALCLNPAGLQRVRASGPSAVDGAAAVDAAGAGTQAPGDEAGPASMIEGSAPQGEGEASDAGDGVDSTEDGGGCGALECFVKMFTTKAYVRALHGETPAILGTGLDELMRHVPALRPTGINMAIRTLEALCAMGGSDGSGSASAEEASSAEAADAVPMDTDAEEPSAREESKKLSKEKEKADKAADALLPECMSNVARLLETMLSHHETARVFVERGGMALMLKLYALPLLPASQAGSSATQTLSAAFRAFLPTHAPALAAEARVALAAQLSAAAAAASELAVTRGDNGKLDVGHAFGGSGGGSGSNASAAATITMGGKGAAPASAGDTTAVAAAAKRYAAALAAAEGLVNLYASLVRSSQSVVAAAVEPAAHLVHIAEVLQPLGEAQRMAHWLLAAAERSADIQTLRAHDDRAAAASTAAEKSDDADSTPAGAGLVPESPHAGEGGSGANDGDGTTAVESTFTKVMRIAESQFTASQQRATKETVVRFVAAVRLLYMAVGRSLSQRHRRDDPAAPPSTDARNAAAALVRVLLDALRWRGPVGADESTTEAAATAAGYVKRVVDELNGAVFDWRRKSCNVLLLNQLHAQRGVQALAEALSSSTPQLFSLAAAAKHFAVPQMQTDGKGKGKAAGLEAPAVSGELATAGTEKESHEEMTLRIALAAAATRLLALMNNLANPQLLLSNPPTVIAQLTLGPPEELTAADKAALKPLPAEPEELVKEVQARLLGTLLPLWRHEALQCCPGEVVGALAEVLRNAVEGVGALAGVEGRARAPARRINLLPPPFAPSADAVEMIASMGFAEQHARAALVAVGSNSVEMAMEWLLTHPLEEVVEPDSELAAAMSLSLTTDEGGGGASGAEGDGSGGVGGSSGSGAGEAELEATRLAAATALAAKEEDTVCPKVDAPPADEMVHTTLMLACAAASEGALLPLTDLLVALCKRSAGEDRAGVVSAVMQKLCAAAASDAASEAERLAAVKTVAHVLVLMLMKEPGTRAAAADAGLGSTVMDLLQPLVAQMAAQPAAAGTVTSLPPWAYTLLLALDMLLQPKPAPTPAATAARNGRATTATPAAAAAATPGATSTTAASSAQPGRSGGGTTHAAATTTLSAPATPLDAMVEQHEGFVNGEERMRAITLVCSLLTGCYPAPARDDAALPVELGDAEAAEAATGAQTLLQLASRLTRSHAAAAKFLEEGGVRHVLGLRSACLFPGYESVAAAILRHVLEDPMTLQAAMEAEIRSLFSTGPAARASGRMSSRSLLTQCHAVMSRDPRIFMAALRAVCVSEEVGGRTLLTLIKKETNTGATKGQATTPAVTATPASAPAAAATTTGATGAQPPTPSTPFGAAAAAATAAPPSATAAPASGRKKPKPPASFVTLLDHLLEVVQRYTPTTAESKPAATGEVGAATSTSMDVDDKDVPGGDGTAPGEAVAKEEEKKLRQRKAAVAHDSGMRAAFALQVLTEFVFMYSACAGVILKREAEAGALGCGGGDDKGDSAAAAADGSVASAAPKGLMLHVLRHLLYVRSNGKGKGGEPAAAGAQERADMSLMGRRLMERASHFLLAVCVRSADGRRRVMTEVARVLRRSGGEADHTAVPAAAVLKVHVQLVNVLLSAGHSNTGLEAELVRTMKDAGVLPALVKALRDVDLDHPNAAKLVNAILKPTEVLTRMAAAAAAAAAEKAQNARDEKLGAKAAAARAARAKAARAAAAATTDTDGTTTTATPAPTVAGAAALHSSGAAAEPQPEDDPMRAGSLSVPSSAGRDDAMETEGGGGSGDGEVATPEGNGVLSTADASEELARNLHTRMGRHQRGGMFDDGMGMEDGDSGDSDDDEDDDDDGSEGEEEDEEEEEGGEGDEFDDGVHDSEEEEEEEAEAMRMTAAGHGVIEEGESGSEEGEEDADGLHDGDMDHYDPHGLEHEFEEEHEFAEEMDEEDEEDGDAMDGDSGDTDTEEDQDAAWPQHAQRVIEVRYGGGGGGGAGGPAFMEMHINPGGVAGAGAQRTRGGRGLGALSAALGGRGEGGGGLGGVRSSPWDITAGQLQHPLMTERRSVVPGEANNAAADRWTIAPPPLPPLTGGAEGAREGSGGGGGAAARMGGGMARMMEAVSGQLRDRMMLFGALPTQRALTPAAMVREVSETLDAMLGGGGLGGPGGVPAAWQMLEEELMDEDLSPLLLERGWAGGGGMGMGSGGMRDGLGLPEGMFFQMPPPSGTRTLFGGRGGFDDMNAVFGMGGGPMLDARSASWTDDGQPAPAAAAALVASGLETYTLAQLAPPPPPPLPPPPPMPSLRTPAATLPGPQSSVVPDGSFVRGQRPLAVVVAGGGFPPLRPSSMTSLETPTRATASRGATDITTSPTEATAADAAVEATSLQAAAEGEIASSTTTAATSVDGDQRPPSPPPTADAPTASFAHGPSSVSVPPPQTIVAEDTDMTEAAEGDGGDGDDSEEDAAPPPEFEFDGGMRTEEGELTPPEPPTVEETEAAQQAAQQAEAAARGAMAEAATGESMEASVDVIDQSFLDALPPEIRAEVLATQLEAQRRSAARISAAAAAAEPEPMVEAAGEGVSAAAGGAPAPSAATPRATAGATGEQAAGAGEGGTGSGAAAAASGSGGMGRSAAMAEAEDGDGDDGDGDGMQLDPEFLAALPPDIQAELIAQQQAAAAAEAARRARNAAGAAGAGGSGGGAGGGGSGDGGVPALDMDTASILATFPPEMRQEVLMTADDDMLRQLPPDLVAEAQVLRERMMRQYTIPRTGPSRTAGGGDEGGALPMPPPPGHGERGAGRGGRNLPPLPGAAGAGGKKFTDMEGAPLVDDADLTALVRLVRMAQPLSKGLLQRLFMNLCAHRTTRSALLRQLLLILKGAATAPSATVSSTSAADGDAAMADVRAATDEEEEDQRLFGCQAHVVYARGSGVPPLVLRRVLEVLTYLARHPHVTALLLFLRVAGRKEEAQASAAAAEAERKGKAKLDSASSEAAAAADAQLTAELGPRGGSSALELLLELLGAPQFERSSGHLEQALMLMEVVLRASSATSTPAGVVLLEADSKAKEAAAAGKALLASLSPRHVRTAAALLGREGLSETVYTRATAVLKELAAAAPAHRHLFVTELTATAVRLATAMAPELTQLAASVSATPGATVGPAPSTGAAEAAVDAGAVMGLGTRGGASVLRVLQAIRWLMLPAEERAAATTTTPAAVESGGAGAEGVAEGGAEKAAEKKPQEGSEEADAIEALSTALTPFWEHLGQCMAAVEAAIGTASRTSVTSSARSEDAAQTQAETEEAAAGPSSAAEPLEGGRLGRASTLPPAALHVLPLVEAFFVLCSTTELAQHRQTATGAGATGSVQADTVAAAGGPGSPGSALRAGALPSSSGLSGSFALGSPLVRFAERHRKLLNALVRQRPALLEGSLALLLKVPRLIDFDNKRAHFRARIMAEQAERHPSPPMRISVRRPPLLLEDSFRQLRVRNADELRGRLTVQFQGEEGIDAGGVTREWYTVLCREMFNVANALFVTDSNNSATFQPSPNSYVHPDHLAYFKFIGRVVGKALYDGQLLDAHFTRSFYKHILGTPITYEDIEAIDPDYYKNLKWMLENDITNVLDLNFSAELDHFGKHAVVDLVPNGSNIPVTELNKLEYVQLISQHRMSTAIQEQIAEFKEGFHSLIPKQLISIFNDRELELLISGLPEIDLDDLQANTEYTGFTAASAVIQMFWEVVRDFSREDLARFLQFCTGTTKVPLEGFKALQGISGPQRFQIHRAYGAPQRLVSAHTCFNQLDLPEYSSKAILQERLMLAIHEGAEGFGFG